MIEQAVSPLRRRMIEDMTIRKFAQKTQHDYVQRVKDFAKFLGRSPDTAKAEDVRGFQLHLTSSGARVPKINATVAAMRFFFNVTLDRPDLAKPLSTIHEPRTAALGGHVARCENEECGHTQSPNPVRCSSGAPLQSPSPRRIPHRRVRRTITVPTRGFVRWRFSDRRPPCAWIGS